MLSDEGNKVSFTIPEGHKTNDGKRAYIDGHVQGHCHASGTRSIKLKICYILILLQLLAIATLIYTRVN